MRPTSRLLRIVLNLSLLPALLATQAFAKSPSCSEVGGALLTNVGGFGLVNNHATTLGVATGDLKGAVGVEILEGNPIAGFTVQHHWVTDDGETLNIDQAHANGTFVNDAGLFAITDYKFTVSGGTGHFQNLSGTLSAIGEIDFAAGHAILRYAGTLCHSSEKP
ncbi:MAG TPA: hypothetical protein VG498_18720 [Terriglobales bacterium]|nr:hypothetical protein [Terriglobales bacterium]